MEGTSGVWLLLPLPVLAASVPPSSSRSSSSPSASSRWSLVPLARRRLPLGVEKGRCRRTAISCRLELSHAWRRQSRTSEDEGRAVGSGLERSFMKSKEDWDVWTEEGRMQVLPNSGG